MLVADNILSSRQYGMNFVQPQNAGKKKKKKHEIFYRKQGIKNCSLKHWEAKVCYNQNKVYSTETSSMSGSQTIPFINFLQFGDEEVFVLTLLYLEQIQTH